MPPPDRERAVDTAWHIHDSLCDWTGKVDVKAAFALSIESAALIAILAIATGKHRLGHLRGAAEVFFWIGTASIVIGALWAVFAVTPHIRNKEVKDDWRHNVIYFGHLRYWKEQARPDELVAALEQEDILNMLGRQLGVMGQIAWKKHRYLQYSFGCAVMGCALVAIAAGLA